jgi:hypothetical protein
MKKSNIILASLSLTIAIFILVAFADIRFNGKNMTENILETSQINVPEFRVLVVKDCDLVTISQDNTTSIDLKMRKGIKPPEINYSIKNDTLTLSGVKQRIDSEALFTSVQAGNSLQCILVNDSETRIRFNENSSLIIDADKSKVFISHNSTKKSNDNLRIFARNNSRITSTTFRIDSLEIIAEKSEAHLSMQAGHLCGSAENGSIVLVRQPLTTSFSCDTSSRFSITSNYYKF